MIIREITEADWVEFFPTFTEVVEAGETYAFPVGLSLDEARGWWVEEPPGVTVVALGDDGELLGSAKAGPNRPGRGSHVATASFMALQRVDGASAVRSVSGRSTGHASRAVPQCSSTRWSRRTPSR